MLSEKLVPTNHCPISPVSYVMNIYKRYRKPTGKSRMANPGTQHSIKTNKINKKNNKNKNNNNKIENKCK